MELTMGDLAELLGVKATTAGVSNIGPRVGDKVIIRTVTHYYTGEVAEIDAIWVKLRNASWIADTGRWGEALKTGKLNEVEPFPNGCLVSMGGVIDVSPWGFDLPMTAEVDRQ